MPPLFSNNPLGDTRLGHSWRAKTNIEKYTILEISGKQESLLVSLMLISQVRVVLLVIFLLRDKENVMQTIIKITPTSFSLKSLLSLYLLSFYRFCKSLSESLIQNLCCTGVYHIGSCLNYPSCFALRIFLRG